MKRKKRKSNLRLVTVHWAYAEPSSLHRIPKINLKDDNLQAELYSSLVEESDQLES